MEDVMQPTYLTSDQFMTAVARADPGNRIPYFRGHLPNIGRRYAREQCKEIVETARDAKGLERQGYGVLTQKRHGEDDYEYLFIISKPRRKSS